jgi:hypothetical protein
VLLFRRCPLAAFVALSRDTNLQIQRVGYSHWWQRRCNDLVATDGTWQHGQQYFGWQWQLICYMGAMVQAYNAIRLAFFMQTAAMQQLKAQHAVTVDFLRDLTGLPYAAVLWLLNPQQCTQVRLGCNSIKAGEMYMNSSSWYMVGWAQHYNNRSADEEDPARLLNKLAQLQSFASTVESQLKPEQQRSDLASLMGGLAFLQGADKSGVYLQLFELVVHTSSPQALLLAKAVCQQFADLVQELQQTAAAMAALQGKAFKQGDWTVLSCSWH